MDRLSDTIAQNQILAATTQATLRKGRRLRHNLTPTSDAASLPAAPMPDDIPASRPLPAAMSPVLATHTAITLSPLDLPAEQFRAGLDRRKQNRQVLMDWLRTALVEGVDYGRVHLASKDKCEFARSGRFRECTNPYHWSKPSLFKPGAEKISGMLGMTVHYPSLAGYETAFIAGQAVTQVMLRCELHDAQGRVVAEGVGARNLTQDYGDINKALKMAEKSAHIDATLRLAGLSEVFTQDLEDRPVQEEDLPVQPGSTVPSVAAAPIPAARPARTAPAADHGFTPPRPVAAVIRSAAPPPSVPVPPPASPPTTAIDLIDAEDVAIVQGRIAEIGITEKRVLAWLYKVTKGTVTRFDQLNIVQCTSLLKRLDVWADEALARAAA